MNKKIVQYIIFILYLINFLISTTIFIKFAFDKFIVTNYLIVICFLVLNFIEVIYLLFNLNKKMSKRWSIVLISIFIIQTIVMFIIPIYNEDIGISTVLPKEYNTYGINIKY